MNNTDKIRKLLIEKRNYNLRQIDEINNELELLDEYMFIVKDSEANAEQLSKWCFDNNIICMFCVKEFVFGGAYHTINFKNKEDAMAFKLKWT